jgi:hypothetical protein
MKQPIVRVTVQDGLFHYRRFSRRVESGDTGIAASSVMYSGGLDCLTTNSTMTAQRCQLIGQGIRLEKHTIPPVPVGEWT